jgi:hypothetical protein
MHTMHTCMLYMTHARTRTAHARTRTARARLPADGRNGFVHVHACVRTCARTRVHMLFVMYDMYNLCV